MSGMIVAPQPEAVEQGARILANGGNAFDAALACAWTQFLVDPHSCGVGGYLILTCRLSKDNQPHPIIDAPAVAGSKVQTDMWKDNVIGPNPGGWGFFLQDKVNEDGYQSICVPGIIRGLEFIHERWCTIPWQDLIEPSIQLSQRGWPVGEHLGRRWKDSPQYYENTSLLEKLYVSPESRRIYLDTNDKPYEAGTILRNPDYGKTLEKLAKNGPDDFYEGNLSKMMMADLEKHGSWITNDDLANYQIRKEKPVVIQYRDYTIQTSPAPHGGPTLAAILNILEGYDLVSLGHNSPAYIYLVSMAMKAGFEDRNRFMGDPQFVQVPLDWMLSKDRAQEWREFIDGKTDFEPSNVQTGGPDTTHTSVVDRWGNCVSLTHSLGSSSGVITPGLGFMYNNSMINFHPYPDHPNSILAGKGRTTGMTPTIVWKDHEPVLVLGAPGATRIITGVLTVILNHLDFGMSISDSVLSPRFDSQGGPITCQARIPAGECAEVRKKHEILRLPQSHGGFGLVHAIQIDSKNKKLNGAADTGADGMALLVEDS